MRAIRVFSRDEYKHAEMARAFDEPRLRFLIGDVRDRERLARAMDGVDIVVHAAALKRVDAAAYNPTEAVKTNVLGTMNVIEAALDRHVHRVMALSTDKAAAPLTLYGATKLVLEKVVTQANDYGGLSTRFACVRYGNVVGSRGSLVPLLLEQRRSGVVTLTDPQMTRFWIRMDEVVRFIARRIEEMVGGEVFVPVIPSVWVTDVIKAVAPKAEVKTIGIRAEEKLHEVMVSRDESRDAALVGRQELGERYYRIQRKRGHGDEFEYASGTNDRFLSVAEIREQILGREVLAA